MQMRIWMALLLCALLFACCSCRSGGSGGQPATTPDEDGGVAATESTEQNSASQGPTTESAEVAKPAAGEAKPSEPVPPPQKNVRYSRYNLHYYVQGETCKASWMNWTDCPGHAFLPYNTTFKMGISARRNSFELTAVETGLRILFEFSSPNMGGMSAREYFNLITSPTPVSYSNLSDADKEGIGAGKAVQGMSKQGVMIALGYPAKSLTPSTDLNTWTYSRNRFRQLKVIFDNDGTVGSVQ
jgi:hypothetical protein